MTTINPFSENHPGYSKAAEIILLNYPKPGNFLSFVANAQDWVHNCAKHTPSGDNEDNKDHAHFCLFILIKEIIIPWVESTPENKYAIIEKGLRELFNYAGYQEYTRLINRMQVSFSKELTECQYDFDSDFVVDSLSGIDTLTQIGTIFYEMDKDLEKIKYAGKAVA